MIVKRQEEQEVMDKLNVSKRVSTSLSESLQLLNERFMVCVKDVDSSEIEEVEFANGLITRLNDLIELMSKSQKSKYNRLEYIKLTDDFGNPVTEYKLWVVGEFYIENGKASYYKRRIVRARTPKEAVYKYKKVDSSLDSSLSCLGEKDNVSDYCFGIENEEVID